MNAETFCSEFETFAEAPNGIQKLREMILQLAVQGKLVPQDDRDEPASTLLNSRATDWAALLTQMNIRSREAVTALPVDSTPFPVPTKWEFAKLGSIGVTQTGSTPSTQDLSNFGHFIPFIKPGDMTHNGIDFENEGLSETGIKNGRLIPSGSVLMVCIGGSIGKAGIVDRKVSCNQQINAVTPLNSVDGKYLLIALRSHYFQRLVNERAGQGTLPILSKSKWDMIPVPIPPLAEQRRIVAKVGQLLGLCDEQAARREARSALVAATLDRLVSPSPPAEFPTHTNRLRNHFDQLFDTPTTIPQLRQTILQLAVQGQLVPQDPNDEPAINNLEQIESEKAALIEARKLRPNRVTELSQTRLLQYEIPDSWRWFRLVDVVFFQEGPGIRNWQFRTEGTKLLNVQNIVDGRLVLDNSERFISNEEFEQTYRHFAVETGDILFASSGGSWGKFAWFEDPGYTVMLNTSMVRLKFYSRRCDDAFLLLFLRTKFFRTQMDIQLVGMQPNFGSTHLGRVYIPIPPLAEQNRIVTKVTELLSLCDALEAKLTQVESAGSELLAAAIDQLLSTTSIGLRS